MLGRPPDAFAARSRDAAARSTPPAYAMKDPERCGNRRHVSGLAGRGVYCTLLRGTHTGRDLLRGNSDIGTEDLGKPEDPAINPVVFVFGLFSTVLACGQLVGRRYIDPGSGSFAIQIIIAAVLGGLLTARLWLRHFFWRVFGRLRRSKNEELPAGEEADR